MDVKRLLPLSGIVFVALVAFAVAVLGGSTPSSDSSAAEIASFYDSETIRQGITAFVLAASVPFLVFFGIGLASAVAPREAARSVWELVLIAGTVLTGGAVLIVAMVHFALVDAVDQGISGGALQALAALDSNTWMAFSGAFGVMMLGAAGILIPRVSGHRWLGRTALVLGVALFIPFADFFALLLTAVWIVVTSVTMARGGSSLSARPFRKPQADPVGPDREAIADDERWRLPYGRQRERQRLVQDKWRRHGRRRAADAAEGRRLLLSESDHALGE